MTGGGDVLLAAPREPVRRLLSITTLDSWFCVYVTVAEALVGTDSNFSEQRESA
jgi:hypothetical protein